MKLVIIFGPQAVGKMTVGQELAKITELKLFHGHMTIDLVANFFSYSTQKGRRLVKHFREEIFKEVASSDLEGLIFTYVWNFDEKADWDYLDNLVTIFNGHGGSIYYVELETNMPERLRRNKTENRLAHKPSKRDLKFAEEDLIKTASEHRLNSEPGEIKVEHYIRIDNTNLDPETVAMQIKKTFNL